MQNVEKGHLPTFMTCDISFHRYGNKRLTIPKKQSVE